MSIVDLADVRLFHEINANDESAADALLTVADKWVKTYIGTAIESASYTERLSGDGTPLLKPRHWPITAVTTLTVDEDSWSTLLSTNATDSDEEVFLPAHGLWLEARYGSVFPSGVGNVVIVYTAGYTSATMPADLKHATTTLVHLLLSERTKVGQGSRTIGPESINQILRDPNEYGIIKDTLNHYRRRGH